MVVVKKYSHLFSIQYLNELIQLLLSFYPKPFYENCQTFKLMKVANYQKVLSIEQN